VACPGSTDTWQNKQKCAITRALEMTKTLRSQTSPIRPIVNGEGPYEFPISIDPTPPENRYGMRHAAYASLFTGAAGFTAGVNGNDKKTDEPSITAWDRPLLVLQSDGIKDMEVPRLLLKSMYPSGNGSWGEFNRVDGILVDTKPPAQDSGAGDRRIISGNNGFEYAVYVPNSGAVEVTSALQGFDCTKWQLLWNDPRSYTKSLNPCPSKTSGLRRFERPLRCGNPVDADRTGACDWVILLRRPRGSGPAEPFRNYVTASRVEGTLDGELMPIGGDQVVIQLVDPTGVPLASEAVVSPPESADYGIPRVETDSLTGIAWAIWESKSAVEGDASDILARRIAADGTPLGSPFVINQQTLARQYHPFIVLDAMGHVTVFWASVTNTDDPNKPKADIIARRFEIDGTALSNEYVVNVSTDKNQDYPLAGADAAGNVVVGWLTKNKTVLVRLYDANGTARTGEIQVNATSSSIARVDLVEIMVDPLGGFVVRWHEYSAADDLLGWYSRSYDANGQPLSEAVLEGP
jgi:hypothetical protein